MIKGTVHKAWFRGMGGGVKFFCVVKMPVLVNCKDVVTFMGILSPIY